MRTSETRESSNRRLAVNSDEYWANMIFDVCDDEESVESDEEGQREQEWNIRRRR